MSEQKERETLYSIPDAADLSGVKERTLRYAVAEGHCTSTKISGRKYVTLADVEAWKQSPHYMPERKPKTK